MKKAFTLIELMISIILLSIIVTFLYQAVAQLQASNQQLLKRADGVDLRENVLELLYNDFINASSVAWPDRLGATDKLVLKSSNSFYDMSMPYVHYRVAAEEKTLWRIESPNETLAFDQKLFRFDAVLKEVETFKVYENNGHYFVYLKSREMDDIYLDIVPPAIGFKSEEQKDANATSADNNESGLIEGIQDEAL